MKHITNTLVIDETKSVELYTNGEKGDAAVTLMRAETGDCYLETNGNPVLVHQENTEEVAIDLGIDEEELRSLVPYLD